MGDAYAQWYSAAVLPVLEWVKVSEWSDTFEAHIGEFYEEFGEAVEIPASDILAALPTPIWGKAAMCAFEDFLTLEFEATPSNALDQYLDEFGAEIEPSSVDFLVAYRNSVVRTYFVESRTPQGYVTLRDHTDGKEAIEIEDEGATAILKEGDNIATRIITLDNTDYLAGAVLVLDDETLTTFGEAFEITFKEEMRNVEKYLQKDLRQRNIVRQRVQKGAAPVITRLWLAKLVADLASLPVFATVEDPETVFRAEMQFTCEPDVISECLDGHPDTDRPTQLELFWAWHMDRSDPEASVKAYVWITDLAVCLESCERERIEAVITELESRLPDTFDPADIFDANDDDWEFEEEDEEFEAFAAKFPAPADGEDFAEFSARLTQFLDDQFRSSLDEEVPGLDGDIPRELVKTEKGRQRVAQWLEDVDAQLQSGFAEIGFTEYSLDWAWKELGIEDDLQPKG